MDDFDYSFQISELDWDSFFQACEECNMLPPGLAGLDESGMSDIDDMANQQTWNSPQTAWKDPELRIDGPPDCDGSPVELYLSKYGLGSPEQVLSGSEDDFHAQAVNVFFEGLRSVSVSEDHTKKDREKAGHLEGSDAKGDDKKTAVSVEKAQSYNNQTAQINDCHTYKYNESTNEDLGQELHKSNCPNKELFIKEEDWSLDVLKEGDKWEAKMRTLTGPGTEKCPCNVLAIGNELTDPNEVKELNCQLVTNNDSDLPVVPGQPSSVTPRRRRRKKKRISEELMEMDPGIEAQLPSKVSDSEEDTYLRRGQMDRETPRAEYCGSGTVSEACCAPHDFLAQCKKNSISENLSVFPLSAPVKKDTKKSTLISINLHKELSKSVVGVAQSKKEIDIMTDSNLTGKSTETEQLDMRADLKSLKSGSSVTETLQSDNNLLAFAGSVSKIERKPANTGSLGKLSVSHPTSDVKSQTDSTAVKQAPLIQSHNVVYSKIPASESKDRGPLSDFQFDGFSAVGQRKTSISCETVPELTDKTLFLASYKNTENKKNSSSVSHVKVLFEHKNGALKAKGNLSVTPNFRLLTQADHVNMALISHQNGHMTQMIAAQKPKEDEIKDDPLVEPTADIVDQKPSKKPGISNGSVNLQREDWTDETSPALELKSEPESQSDINIETVEILSPGIKGERNDEPSLKGQTEQFQSLIHTTEPDIQLSDYLKSKPTVCNTLTNDEEQKSQILYVDTPPCFLSKDLDLSPTVVVWPSPSPLPESTSETKSIETLETVFVSQPTPPVYAMSSFWNEMEKLTINDILRLRLVGQAQHPSMLLQPEDSSIADVTDAADSGYFTHSDDSKPDHSSGNISFMSDLDGELAQLLPSDAAKLNEGEQESPNATGIFWEIDPNLSRTATGAEDVFNLDTACSSPLFRNNSTHCFRKMCKNVSVQNLQALEAQNVGKCLRNATFHSLHSVYSTRSEVEDDYVDPFDRVETSSPVYLSDEEEMDNIGITFSEIFEYLFGTDETEQPVSQADPVAASYLNETGTSAPDMYDYFFSEFDSEDFFYPLANDNSSTYNELVPIFSSSRSATRNVQFPEVYDYFFPDDSPVHSDEDEEPEHAVIRVVTRYDQMPTKNHNSVTASDICKNLFPEKDDSCYFLWTNPFSFRRVRRNGFTVPPKESSSLAPFKNTDRAFRGGFQSINILGADESLFPDPLILSLENPIFRQLADQQKICSVMQSAIADPSKP